MIQIFQIYCLSYCLRVYPMPGSLQDKMLKKFTAQFTVPFIHKSVHLINMMIISKLFTNNFIPVIDAVINEGGIVSLIETVISIVMNFTHSFVF